MTKLSSILNLLQCFMAEMTNPANQSVIPAGISGKQDVVFGNMNEIYEFHNK